MEQKLKLIHNAAIFSAHLSFYVHYFVLAFFYVQFIFKIKPFS